MYLQGSHQDMSSVANYITDLLNEDMVSHGLLVQCVEDDVIRGDEPLSGWKVVLDELLSGEVEIGTAKSANGEYVEFIAWKGSTKDRISRAVEALIRSPASAKEFAYWLCLRKNIDRYDE
jgi:hypothetical protein